MNKILLALALSSPAFAGERICGFPSAPSTYEESVQSAHGGLAAALAQLYGFPDVQRLIRSMPGAKVCASGIALSKNIYQYNKYLIVIELETPGRRLVTPIVFQTASVQAYENVGAKPWLGLPRRDLVSSMRDALADAPWTEVSAEEFGDVGRIFEGAGEPVDDKSISVVFMPDVEASRKTYLISRLRLLGGANVFTSQYLLDVAAVQFDGAGRARFAVLRGFFSRYAALEDAQAAASPGAGASDEARLAALVRISE